MNKIADISDWIREEKLIRVNHQKKSYFKLVQDSLEPYKEYMKRIGISGISKAREFCEIDIDIEDLALKYFIENISDLSHCPVIVRGALKKSKMSMRWIESLRDIKKDGPLYILTTKREFNNPHFHLNDNQFPRRFTPAESSSVHVIPDCGDKTSYAGCFAEIGGNINFELLNASPCYCIDASYLKVIKKNIKSKNISFD